MMFLTKKTFFLFCIMAIIPLYGDNLVKEKTLQVTQDVKDIHNINTSQKNIEKKITTRHYYFESTLKKLYLIEKQYKNSTNAQLKDSLSYVEAIWRGLVKRSFANMSSEFLQEDLPKINTTEPFLEKMNTSEKVSEHYSIFDNWLNKKIDDDQNLYNTVLLLSGKLRSKLVQETIKRGNEYVNTFTMTYFDDLINEIQIIPIRWGATLVSKIYDWKRNVNIGVKGIKIIISDILLMLSSLISIFLLIFNFTKISNFIESFGSRILEDKIKKYNFFYYVFYLVNAVSSLVLMLVIINIGGFVIRLSSVDELSELTNLANYYIFYKITIIVITRGITKLKIDGKMRFSYLFYKDFFNTVRLFAFVLFLYFSLMQIIDTVVGKVLLYRLVDLSFLYCIGGVFLYEVWVWRERTDVLFERLVPNSIFIRTISKHLQKMAFIKSIFQLSAIFISSVLLFFNNIFSKTKLSSHISSYIFIRKVKAAHNSSYTLNKENAAALMQNYNTLFFNQQHNLFNIEKEQAKEISTLISDWHLNNALKNSVSIIGDKGSGVSVLMDQVQEESESFILLRIKIPYKCAKLDDFLQHIAHIINQDVSSVDELEEILFNYNNQEPFIIMIDDAHHLFMAKIGGFDVIHTIMSLMSNERLPIFWVSSYHSFSWYYLRMIFSKNALAQIEMFIAPWEPDDIQNLILHRHKQTNTNISLDDLGLALKPDANGQLKETESQYFTLLYEKSSGNPSTALTLWSKSLYPSHTEDTLYVGLPKSFDFNIQKIINNDALLILATIIKHGALTKEQIQELTSLTKCVIFNEVKKLALWNIIDFNADQYLSISCEFAPKVYKVLKGMNYIYGR